jgi:hypothetical protein
VELELSGDLPERIPEGTELCGESDESLGVFEVLGKGGPQTLWE